jgi:hypothetical protein
LRSVIYICIYIQCPIKQMLKNQWVIHRIDPPENLSSDLPDKPSEDTSPRCTLSRYSKLGVELLPTVIGKPSTG